MVNSDIDNNTPEIQTVQSSRQPSETPAAGTGAEAIDPHVVCESKLTEAMNGWKRAQADYVNLQREVARERETMGRFAAAEVVGQFLPIYDYFKQALRQQPHDNESSASLQNWAQGMNHIADLFRQTLKQFGVEEVATIGQQFDPQTMEAVQEIAVADSPAGVVIEEIEGGYQQGGRLLKPAKVIVNQHQ